MSYLTIILAIIILIILYIIFKTVLKAFFKIFFYTSLTIILVSSVIGFLVYRDAREFSNKFTTSDNIFLLEENNNLLAGFVLHPGGEPSIVDEGRLMEYKGYYNNNQLDKIIGSNYKVFVIKANAFKEEGIVEFDDKQYDRKLVMSILRSDDPVGTYVDGVSESFGLIGVDRESIRSDVDGNELKISFFVIMYVNDLGTDPINIILQYKNGNVIVYPESMMFKFIKLMPTGIIESAGLLNEKLYKQKITGSSIWEILQ